MYTFYFSFCPSPQKTRWTSSAFLPSHRSVLPTLSRHARLSGSMGTTPCEMSSAINILSSRGTSYSAKTSFVSTPLHTQAYTNFSSPQITFFERSMVRFSSQKKTSSSLKFQCSFAFPPNQHKTRANTPMSSPQRIPKPAMSPLMPPRFFFAY